jgi:putative tricarboxylic transport membrane protein
MDSSTAPDSDSSEDMAYRRLGQTLMGAGALFVAAVLVYGAMGISSDAGYAGVGPNFLPWVIATAMGVCGVWLLWEARTGGFRHMDMPTGAPRGDFVALAWVSAGILANAALITTIGFVLSCALCYLLAVRGLRASEGKPAGDMGRTVRDAIAGMVIAAPVFWLFTKLLAVNLPGVTSTGWL